MTTAMERYRPIFLIVTFAFLGAAFYMSYRPGNAPTKLMRANKVMLWVVTLVAVIFLFAPNSIMGLFGAEDEFTVDMQRSVIAIEGMT